MDKLQEHNNAEKQTKQKKIMGNDIYKHRNFGLRNKNVKTLLVIIKLNE
jgi:hypothetical protein